MSRQNRGEQLEDDDKPDDVAEIELSSDLRLSVDLWQIANPECWVASVHDDPGLFAQQPTREEALTVLKSEVESVISLGLL
jgi:hypothetical protein